MPHTWCQAESRTRTAAVCLCNKRLPLRLSRCCRRRRCLTFSWQISTHSHPSPPPRLPRPSITASTHWNTQPAAAVSSRQSLTSEQGFLRAQMLIAIPLPVFFSKKLFFWFNHVSFFYFSSYPFQSRCDGLWIYCQVFCERWNSSERKSESVGLD